MLSPTHSAEDTPEAADCELRKLADKFFLQGSNQNSERLVNSERWGFYIQKGKLWVGLDTSYLGTWTVRALFVRSGAALKSVATLQESEGFGKGKV